MSRKDQNTEIVVVNSAVADKLYNDDGAIDALKNKDLQKHIRSYAKAEGATQKNLWTINKSIALIMANEEFKDDFGTDKEFARFMGLSCSTISKMKRVASIVLGNANMEQLGFRVAQAEEFLPLLKGDHIDGFFDIMHPTPDQNRDELRAMVKEYRTMLEEIDKGSAEDATENDTSTETTEESTDSLENYDDTDTDEYLYTLPLMGTDGSVDVCIKCKGFKYMEILAKAVSAIVSKHSDHYDIMPLED